MTTAIGSGPLIPVVSSPSSPVQAGPALPVYVYTSLPAGRSQSGAKPIPVKFLSASDLVQNGGSYTLAGPPTALPVISVAANVYGVQGGSALPVYDVTNLVYPQPQPNPPPVGPVLPEVASATLLLNLQADALALADGDPVPTWANAGTLGGSFTAADAARPTKQSDANGPYVAFDGVTNVMTAGAAPNAGLDNLDSFAVFCVVRTDGGAHAIATKMFEESTHPGWSLFTFGILVQEDGGIQYVLDYYANPPLTGFHVITGMLLSRTVMGAVFVDGSNNNIIDSSSLPVGSTTTTEPVRLGALGIADSCSKISLRAVMVYAPAPNDTDRAAIEAWLAAKYGITP